MSLSLLHDKDYQAFNLLLYIHGFAQTHIACVPHLHTGTGAVRSPQGRQAGKRLHLNLCFHETPKLFWPFGQAIWTWSFAFPVIS